MNFIESNTETIYFSSNLQFKFFPLNVFQNRYGALSFTLSNLVESILSRLKTKYELSRVEEFMRKATLGIATASFEQGVETIKTNIRWLDTNKDGVNTWLTNNP